MDKSLDLLRTSHEITNYYFICRVRDWHKDGRSNPPLFENIRGAEFSFAEEGFSMNTKFSIVLDPGVSWYLVDADSQEQTEFKTHDQWCKVIMKYRKKMAEKVQKDVEVNKAEWKVRPSQPLIEMKIIEGRKMDEMPETAESYIPPGFR